jgi:hypothetical protein
MDASRPMPGDGGDGGMTADDRYVRHSWEVRLPATSFVLDPHYIRI